MSNYKPYPAYKNSGVEWIGDVPEHWDIARIKHASSLRTSRCTDAPDDSQYIGLEDVESGTGQYRPTKGSARQNEDSTVGVFRSGDVLYGKLRPYLKKTIISDADGVCSTEFLVLQPKTVLAPWLHQWLLTTGVTQQIEAGCEGTKMPRADWEHVGSIHVPLPDESEQAEIISVLDCETKRISSLITKKTRFIELLKEKRKALITHAVTKGLDPNVKMKDSGVEWIGEVPEDWRVCSLGYITRSSTGGTPDRKVDSYWNGSIPWAKTGEIRYETISKTEEFITLEGLSNSAAFIAEPGTILMAMYGKIKVPVPPYDEQLSIIKRLVCQLQKLEALESRALKTIDLLKERRSAFITAAVTGQIDLRESV